jgi:integrase
MGSGIEVRHQQACASLGGGRCNCQRGYRVRVWDPRERRVHVKTLRDKDGAEEWRDDVRRRVRSGTMRAEASITVAQAAEALIAGLRRGSVLDRTGRPYKPATVRGYTRDLRSDVIPALGQLKLTDVRRRDVQGLVDELRSRHSASTVRNKLNPLRVIFRRALRDELIAIDPTSELELPSVRMTRDRIATPEQAAVLIQALPACERPLWTVALYAGLRIGELRALRWSDVDLEENVVRVRRGWDDKEGVIDPKSDAGTRKVPLVGAIRLALLEQKLATGRDGEDLVFGRTAGLPFSRSTVRDRALRAWKQAALEPLTPHEARHCAVSYMIAAGLNPKQISTYIGHGDVRQTWNRYGHLMPGDEVSAAAQLDAFLARSVDSSWTAPRPEAERPVASLSGPRPLKSG